MSRRVAAHVLAVIRPIIFILGLLFGLLFAVSLFMLASAAGQFVGVFGGLGLALASPLCWLGAIRTRAKDRFTFFYVCAWVVLILATLIVGAIENGKQVQSGDGGGMLALGLVAIVYLVITPLGLLRFRERHRGKEAGSRPFGGPPWS